MRGGMLKRPLYTYDNSCPRCIARVASGITNQDLCDDRSVVGDADSQELDRKEGEKSADR